MPENRLKAFMFSFGIYTTSSNIGLVSASHGSGSGMGLHQ